MKKSLLGKPAAAVFAMLTTCGLLFAYNNLGFADSAQPSRSSVTSVAPGGAADLSDSKGQVSADGTSAQGKDSTSAKAKNPICAAGRFSKYRKFLKTSKIWPNESSYRASGWGPHSTLILNKMVTVANTVSGTFGVDVGHVSATVGFSVTKSWSTNLAFSAPLNKKRHYTVRAGKVYKVYVFNVYERRGHLLGGAARARPFCNPDKSLAPVYVGTGTAKKFWTFDFKLTAA